MAVVIQLRAFHHEEEALLVLAEQLDAFQRSPFQQVATLSRERGIHIVGYAEGFSLLDGLQLLPGARCLPPLLVQLLEDVAAILAVGELLRSTAEDVVGLAVGVVADNLLLLISVGVVAAEVGRRGIPESAGHGYTRSESFLLGIIDE